MTRCMRERGRGKKNADCENEEIVMRKIEIRNWRADDMRTHKKALLMYRQKKRNDDGSQSLVVCFFCSWAYYA